MKNKPDRLPRREPGLVIDGDACPECYRHQGHSLNCPTRLGPCAASPAGDSPADPAPVGTVSRYFPGMQRAATLLRRGAGELYAVGDDKAAKWMRKAALRVEEGIRSMREGEKRQAEP